MITSSPIAIVEVAFGGALILLAILLSLAVGAFYLWMLIDCLLNEDGENNEKLIWILLMIFIPLLGAVLYFFIRKLGRGPKATVDPYGGNYDSGEYR